MNLKGNMTMYISLQKAVHSDKMINTMYLITGIIIAGTIFGMFEFIYNGITTDALLWIFNLVLL